MAGQGGGGGGSGGVLCVHVEGRQGSHPLLLLQVGQREVGQRAVGQVFDEREPLPIDEARGEAVGDHRLLVLPRDALGEARRVQLEEDGRQLLAHERPQPVLVGLIEAVEEGGEGGGDAQARK